jgi:hypothetical protein
MSFTAFSHMSTWVFAIFLMHEHMSFKAFSHMSTWVFAIFLMYEHMSFTKFSHMSTWVFAIFLMYEKFEDMSFRCFRMRRIWIFSHVNLRFSMRISYIFSHYFSYELHERENIVWDSYEFTCKLIEHSCEFHMSCMWVSYENWLIMRNLCTGSYS